MGSVDVLLALELQGVEAAVVQQRWWDLECAGGVRFP